MAREGRTPQQTSDAQRAQRELVRTAEAEPTVAELMRAYEDIRKFAPEEIVASAPRTRFATGGNG